MITFLKHFSFISCMRQMIVLLVIRNSMVPKTHLVLVLIAVADKGSLTEEIIKKNEFVLGVTTVSRVDGAACHRDTCVHFRKLIPLLWIQRCREGSPNLLNHWQVQWIVQEMPLTNAQPAYDFYASSLCSVDLSGSGKRHVITLQF